MADTGTTYNSSATYQHMVSHNPDFAMFFGDLTYADTWTSTGIQGGSIPTPFYALTTVKQSQTYQPRWCAAGL
jgi:phosphodiesterase/alkaline phosphatase D-like protein